MGVSSAGFVCALLERTKKNGWVKIVFAQRARRLYNLFLRFFRGKNKKVRVKVVFTRP